MFQWIFETVSASAARLSFTPIRVLTLFLSCSLSCLLIIYCHCRHSAITVFKQQQIYQKLCLKKWIITPKKEEKNRNKIQSRNEATCGQILNTNQFLKNPKNSVSNLIHLGWSWKQCDVLPRDGSTGRAPRPVATQWGPAGRVMSQSGDRGFWELLRKKKKRIEAPAPSIGRSCRRPTGCRFNDSGLVGHVDMSPDWLIQPLKSSRDESLMDATGHWSINQQQQQQQHMIRRSLIHGAARHLWTATRQPSTASLNHDPRFESFMLTPTLVESTPWPGWCRKVSLDGRGMAWRGPR